MFRNIPVAEMRREKRPRRAADFRLDRSRTLELLVSDVAKCPHPLEDIVAPLERLRAALGASPLVGAEARRRLNHPCEHRRFAKPEFFRAFAEPALRCRLYADEVRAEGGTIKVLRDNPFLRLRAFHLDGLDRFLPLPPEILRVGFKKPHRLHRNRRRAGDAPPATDILPCRTKDAHRPHAVVRPKRTVFGSYERLYDPVIGRGDVERTTVDITGPKRHAQDSPRRVAKYRAAGIFVRPLVAPADEDPRANEKHRRERGDDAGKKSDFPLHALYSPQRGKSDTVLYAHL